MKQLLVKIVNAIFDFFGLQLIKKPTTFAHPWYIRINNRRQEHLASLNLNIANKTVLEIGAGVGDHTEFWIDRKSNILITEVREENLKILRSRFPNEKVQTLDLEKPSNNFNRTFDIVYCYGLLYHLGNPEEALKFMSKCCKSVLLLESCVSYGDEENINYVKESTDTTQSFSGTGCRPTRVWIFNQLKRNFNYVYMPLTQPAHPEFPLDWNSPSELSLTRAVFIASKTPISNSQLVSYVPAKQYLDIQAAL